MAAAIEQSLGPEHVQLATTLHMMSDLLRHDEALEVGLRALVIWSEALGPGHSDSIRALVRVASIRRARGDLQGSVRDAQRAVELGDEHGGVPAQRFVPAWCCHARCGRRASPCARERGWSKPAS